MKEYLMEQDDFCILQDILTDFEKDYQISLNKEELSQIKSFEELLSLLVNKFDYEDVNDCTEQQAFYKLRKSIIELNPNVKEIALDTELEDIFPESNRKSKLAKLKKSLGMKLEILEGSKVENFLLILGVLASMVYMFFSFNYGLLGLAISIYFLHIANRDGNSFSIKTVRDLVKYMVKRNYFKCRRNPLLMNKKEFREVVFNYFLDRMDLEEEELRTAVLFK